MIDELLSEALTEGIEIHEHAFNNNRIKGLYIDCSITLNKSAMLSETEKCCVIAEELGHHYTSYGNILDQKCIIKRKQEYRARSWAYEKLVPLDKFLLAFKSGIRNRHELADLCGVTEDFLQSSINYYLHKYGLHIKIDEEYIICLDPLGVIKLFDN